MTSSNHPMRYKFVKYESDNMEERQYLDMCENIIDTGYSKSDRTGTGTFSMFGKTMRFSLNSGEGWWKSYCSSFREPRTRKS